MSKYTVLYNPKAGNGSAETETRKLDEILAGSEIRYIDITGIKSYAELFSSMDKDAKLVISGGDGTLNRFVNDTEGEELPERIYYFATGTGNDFLLDIGKTREDGVIDITEYLKDLPTVTVNGKSFRFINAIGFGIDGYCCEVGDKLREKSDKRVDYTGIAIKGLLFHFKPTNAEVTVDGVKHSYKKVWIAPTMHGRYYGGGMKTAPEQNRLDRDSGDSFAVMYGKGRLRTLIMFPSIFKGEHVRYTDSVEIIRGHNITVRFDRPTALQIDGETILNVSEYSVKTARAAEIKEAPAVR